MPYNERSLNWKQIGLFSFIFVRSEVIAMIMKLITVASVILYLCIGVIVDSAVSEDWQGPCALIWIFWPIVVLLGLLCLVFNFLYEIGKNLDKKLKKGSDIYGYCSYHCNGSLLLFSNRNTCRKLLLR